MGGTGLARGYLNRPELTKERFIKNPFVDKAKNKNLRLYKTGDLARYLTDGNIEFLGRIDDQVKMRGFRIEPGEIESTLRQYKFISNVAVIAQEIEPGDKRLVAYLVHYQDVPDKQTTATLIKELRQALTEKLPDYMVPSYFMFIERLPLNANGKLDKKALPKPSVVQHLTEYFELPASECEKQIATIWAELLKIEETMISRDANFFYLGGHSLLLPRLALQLKRTFGRNFFIQDILQAPTLSALALKVEDSLKASASYNETQLVIPLQTSGKKKSLFLVHSATTSAHAYLPLKEHLPDQPLYAIEMKTLLEQQADYHDIAAMAEDYIKAIKIVQEKGPYILGGWSFGGLVALTMAQKLIALGEKVSKVILIDSYNPLCYQHLSQIQQQSLQTKLTQQMEALYNDFPAIEKQLLMTSYQESMRLTKTFQIENYQEPVVLLKAQSTGLEMINIKLNDDQNNGWNECLPNFKVISIPGDHYQLFTKQLIESTAVGIKQALATNEKIDNTTAGFKKNASIKC